MAWNETQRRELGAFLRSRRESIERSELGLPPGGRQRTRGLRREEVAVFSNVSVTWYTWLEQGRDITPSRQVLEAVASTLRLDDGQRAYVLGLAGYTATPARAEDESVAVPQHLVDLLRAMPDSPAFVLTASWHVAAWNPAYERLYPRITEVPDDERNLLWSIFMDPTVRALLPDWETDSRHFLAEFRAESVEQVGNAASRDLVERLLEASPEFATYWAAHDVERFTSRERAFQHPADGLVRYEHHRLFPADDPSLHLVVYTPVG